MLLQVHPPLSTLLRNFPEYNEEAINNLLFMSEHHLFRAIPWWELNNNYFQIHTFSINRWKDSGHPQVFEGDILRGFV